MNDPMDKVRAELEKLKAMGVTISYKPGPDPTALGARTMRTIHAEAQKIGMTYDDPPISAQTPEKESN